MPATSASPWFNMPFRCYHPYRKVSAFHMTFSQEAPITQKLAMYTIYPADSTAGHLSPVTPLQYDNALHMDEPGRTSSRVYFSKLSTTLPVVPVPKPDGEPGRPGRNGYTMKDVLGWDDMVYNEILVMSQSWPCTFYSQWYAEHGSRLCRGPPNKAFQ